MLQRLKDLIQSIRDAYAGPAVALGGAAADVAGNGAARAASGIAGAKGALLVLAALGAGGYLI